MSSSTPTRYRKRPVVIEAMQLEIDNADDVAKWCDGSVHTEVIADSLSVAIDITTLEGVMRADVGDYIICGVQGEFYPCKPGIFDVIYYSVV